jgi:hypothetical protein
MSGLPSASGSSIPDAAQGRPSSTAPGAVRSAASGKPQFPHLRALLEAYRAALAIRHRSPKTQEAYVSWVRRFVGFRGNTNPSRLANAQVAEFLSSLALGDGVSASTQNQALTALLFLYEHVLFRPLGMVQGIAHAKRPQRLPVVLTADFEQRQKAVGALLRPSLTVRARSVG